MRAVMSSVAVVLLASTPAATQTLMQRVDAVRDGTVRVSFPVREGVCGSGSNVYTTSSRQASDDWESDCDDGPARVVITRRGGATVDIDTYVGGRWKPRTGVTDLGDVSAVAAVELFMTIAQRASDDAGKDAVFPVAIADAPVADRLAGLAQNRDRAGEVREAAIFWVGTLGDDSVLDMLSDLIDTDPDSEIRDRAVFAISRNRSPRAMQLLRTMVEDETNRSSVRERALFWLGQTRTADASAYLKNAFARMQSEALREKIIFSLAQHRTAENADWIVDEVVLAGDLSMELRGRGVFWLGQMRGESDRLIDLYDELRSDELREKLIFAYSQRRRDEAALNKLMEIAREDPRSELRRKAIFWLGQSKDPRAVRFLAELIGQ